MGSKESVSKMKVQYFMDIKGASSIRGCIIFKNPNRLLADLKKPERG
ncbi:MAG: hypothetical protein CM15mP12_3650 [Gammaproteobacteria bacterium]|nr:MAG: hypothetical protein CM15mP12_3650 [Gammaproteobacteria bacterium]